MKEKPQITTSENHKLLFLENQINQYANDFLNEKIRQGFSHHTIENYLATFAAFSKLTIKDFDCKDFINRACEIVAGRKWSNSTLLQHLRRLCSFNSFLFYNSLCLRKHRAPHYKKQPKRRDLPEAHEWQKLFDFLKARYLESSLGRRWGRWRDYLVARILYETGMRIGEVGKLRVGDLKIFDVDEYALFVDGGKTDAAERTCPISEDLCEEIRAFNWTHRNLNKSAMMFAQSRRGRFDESEFCKTIKKIAQDLDLSAKVTPHVFRHNFILEFIKSGGSSLVLMARIGHSDVQMCVYYFNQVRRLFPFVKINDDFSILIGRDKARKNTFEKRGNWYE